MPYNVRLANDAETIKVVDLLFHIWQSVFKSIFDEVPWS